MRINRLSLAVGVMPVLLAVLSAPIASAAIPLGGGSGIAVNAHLCTLTTIGHDGSGDLVGFTSAHCGGPGALVVADGAAGTVGNVVAADSDLDYALIKFDPVKVSPIRVVDDFAINGLGGDPGLWQRVCQQSRATGRACTLTMAPGDDTATRMAMACGNPDDAGAPVTVNDLLIGMIRGGFIPSGGPCPEPGRPIPGFAPIAKYPKSDRPQIVSIDAILDDVNAKGGPGAGFVPVGG